MAHSESPTEMPQECNSLCLLSVFISPKDETVIPISSFAGLLPTPTKGGEHAGSVGEMKWGRWGPKL